MTIYRYIKNYGLNKISIKKKSVYMHNECVYLMNYRKKQMCMLEDFGVKCKCMETQKNFIDCEN